MVHAATGHFDDEGYPCLKLLVTGPSGARHEFNAIIDTGFTGFCLLPARHVQEIGLAVQRTTTTLTLADTRKIVCEMTDATLTFAGISEPGLVHIERNSDELLVGMDFLRQFNLALIITSKRIVLIEEGYLQELSDVMKAQGGRFGEAPE